jgi:small GTP-binding protein
MEEPQTQDNYIRVAVVGNVDSGKSTLTSVLTKSILDDGRGSARLRVFNYDHEAKNGRTSSIANEIMGFDEKGEQIFPEHFVSNKNKYWSEVMARTRKVVSLIDLCGHEKYLKTTMLGMVGMVPDYVMIVVGANLGLSKMTKEHLGIALALGIPFFIVLTKVDMVPEEVSKQTIGQLTKLLHSGVVNKKAIVVDYEVPLFVAKPEPKTGESQSTGTLDAPTPTTSTIPLNKEPSKNMISEKKPDTLEKMHHFIKLSGKEEELIQKIVKMIKSENICPIFPVSSVQGFGFSQLRRFLSCLKSRCLESHRFGKPSDEIQFDIHDTFIVHGVGLVVSGLMKAGTAKIGQQLILGPDKQNNYRPVSIKSVHFNRVQVDAALPGQFCTFALKSMKKKEELDKKDFRKGIVLLDISKMPKYAMGFMAEISVLHHATTIKSGYECVMHCGVIRQSVHILKMDKELLRTGDTGRILFKFMYNEEYLQIDAPFLLREGRTKILGYIKKIYSTKEELEAVEF